MQKKALILGFTGNFGRAQAEALLNDGWQLNIMLRNPKKAEDDALFDNTNISLFKGDAMVFDDLLLAGQDCQVIVHGVNMAYDLWPNLMPKITDNVLNAAKNLNASILFPGNIYNFAAEDGPIYHEQSPQNPTTKKGKFRKQLEQDMAHFAQTQGVQVIILRAGDYWGPKSSESSFFKYLIMDNLPKGKVWLAGRDDVKHAWAYLPDLGAVGAALLAKRESLNLFEIFHFKGNDLTMDEMIMAVEAVVGKPLKRSGFPWLFIRLMGVFNKGMREMLELRFMGSVAQSFNQDKLTSLLDEVPNTPLEGALKATFKAHHIVLK